MVQPSLVLAASSCVRPKFEVYQMIYEMENCEKERSREAGTMAPDSAIYIAVFSFIWNPIFERK